MSKMRKNLIAVAALALLVSLAPAVSADSDNDDRGYLGVSLHFTELLHKDGHAGREAAGLFLGSVIAGGPSDQAGLKPHDKIVALDGRSISDPADLKEYLASARRGDRVAVTVERDGREETFNVVLGEMPQKQHVSLERVGALVEYAENRAFVGVESQPIGQQLARYFGVDGGILIARVIEDTPAEKAGLEAGDVVFALDDHPITKEHDLHEALAKNEPGDRVSLSVSRRGSEMQITVTLGAAREHMKLRERHISPDGDHMLHKQEFDEQKNKHYEIKIREKKGGGE
jgi:serine protease Do